MEYLKGKTVPQLIRYAAEHIHHPDHPCLLYRGESAYEPLSYREVLEKADAISAWFLEAGIQKGNRLGLIIENSPEYVYYDQALQQIGAVNVSIYPTLPEEDMEYIVNDAGIRIILAGSPFLLKKCLKTAGNCARLGHIIPAFDDYRKITESQPAPGKQLLSLSEVIASGKKTAENKRREIEAIREQIRPEDLSSLIYTSGTTGTPKGAMLTHANFVDNVRYCLEHLPVIDHEETFLSFLPLSHVFERTATYYVCMAMGCKMAFAESLEALGRNMGEVRPTVMNVVPRLLERIQEKATRSAKEQGAVKAGIFKWAIATGGKARRYKEKAEKPPFWLSLQLSAAEKLVFSKIKEKTGGRLKFMISGGAALPKATGEFFGNMNIKVLEGYGLTETSPVVAVNTFDRQVIGTVGPVIPGVEIGIQNPDTREILTVQTHESFDPAFECGEGEIIVRGHCVMKGYWNKPADTQAAIDKEGWFHTGDIGRFHQGNLQITDRIKNILVNAYGKNIYPTPVENVYMKSNKIEQLFLIGDRREYVTAIIVPNKEYLSGRFGFEEDFFEQPDPFIKDEAVINWLREDIKKLSPELAKYERIRNFCVKRRPFTIDEGEMTPTLKIKRKVVEEKYAKTIDLLYRQQAEV